MREYRFSLTRILPYQDRICDCPYTGEYGSVKTRINDGVSKPQAYNFAIIRSCGRQSNAFDRSVSNAAYSPT